MSALLQVAFIGTGIMGLPMCRRLLAAGRSLRVWNRTRERAEPLAALGAKVCDSVGEAIGEADVVVCMLDNGPVIDAVLFSGESPPIDRLRRGATLVVMSSIPVDTTERQAATVSALGVDYVDAPVSGGERGATEGTLTIMAGGDAAVIDRLRPLLEALGRVTRIGPVGAGQVCKLANQTIVGITIAAVAEALQLAKAAGADPAAVREALMGGFADSTILKQHGLRMVTGNFMPGARAEIQLKDLRTARRLADAHGRTLPVLRLAEQQYERLIERGLGARDHSALYLLLDAPADPVSPAKAGT
jgi:2-hydroxy-3-oxopropionate reductase